MSATATNSTEGVCRTVVSPPRSAYVHVPFCRHRCGYCNFTLVAGRDDLIGDYLRAIELELARLETTREVDTLYFGGGTPTYLAPEQLRRLGEIVLRWHPLAGGYEWTVEANPADVDAAMIATLREMGVTRLSLGGQSFRDDKLRLLERDHSGRDIGRAVELARDADMQVALDLIFAAPGETIDQWLADIDTAIALRPDHVSTYGLTFERGTAFWSRRLRGELIAADEELEREMYAAVIDRLTAAGFELTTPRPPELRLGVVVAKAEGPVAQEWHERLYRDHGVIGSNTGGLRLSPNICNTLADVDRAVAALTALRSRRS